jgi:hypothetical protein
LFVVSFIVSFLVLNIHEIFGLVLQQPSKENTKNQMYIYIVHTETYEWTVKWGKGWEGQNSRIEKHFYSLV